MGDSTVELECWKVIVELYSSVLASYYCVIGALLYFDEYCFCSRFIKDLENVYFCVFISIFYKSLLCTLCFLGNMQGGGCDRPCMDVDTKVCGCMDDLCTGPTPKGEEHNRRWAVYELLGGKK